MLYIAVIYSNHLKIVVIEGRACQVEFDFVGMSRHWLKTRYMVLVRAGFAVASTCTPGRLRLCLRSLPSSCRHRTDAGRERQKATVAEVRRRWPEIRILFLTNQPISLEQYQAVSTDPAVCLRASLWNCRQILEG